MPAAGAIVRDAADAGRQGGENHPPVARQQGQKMFGDQARANGVDGEDAGHRRAVEGTPAFLGRDAGGGVMKEAAGDQNRVQVAAGVGDRAGDRGDLILRRQIASQRVDFTGRRRPRRARHGEHCGDFRITDEMLNKGVADSAAGAPHEDAPSGAQTGEGRAGRDRHPRCRAGVGPIWRRGF